MMDLITLVLLMCVAFPPLGAIVLALLLAVPFAVAERYRAGGTP